MGQCDVFVDPGQSMFNSGGSSCDCGFLELYFDYTETGNYRLLIGTVPGFTMIFKVVLDIIQDFDNTYISVGDNALPAHFISTTQNYPNSANHYYAQPEYKYFSDTLTYIYFHGLSTIGQGRVIIYYQ